MKDLLIDDVAWAVRFVQVETRGRTVLVPATWIRLFLMMISVLIAMWISNAGTLAMTVATVGCAALAYVALRVHYLRGDLT